MEDSQEKSQSFFGKLFNQDNRWWTLTSIILAPLTGMFMGLRSRMESNSDMDSLFILSFEALFLSYIIAATKHPLKPAVLSLIFTGVGAFLLIFFGITFDQTGYDAINPSYFWYLFMIVFFIISIFPLPICFFRDRSD